MIILNHAADKRTGFVIVDLCTCDLTISVTFLIYVKQLIIACNVFILKIKNMEGYKL